MISSGNTGTLAAILGGAKTAPCAREDTTVLVPR